MGAVKTKYWIYLLKFVGWCIIIGISFLWSATTDSENINSFRMAMFILNIIPLLLIYAINNAIFIPELLFKNKRGWFLIANILFLFSLVTFSYFVDDKTIAEKFVEYSGTRPTRPRNALDFIARDVINYVLMIGFVTALRLMGRLQASEEALKEAENARIKAELDNLKSQINPHFLLNTLNNIYALTAIDSDKAQKAIQELSRLLRYILYDNHSDMVGLKNEVEFLNNYIELMRIRLTKNVKLEVNFNIKENDSTQIAPLIFISLIENAFKHGVSADKPSFIEINMDNSPEKGELTLSIKNSNNAKSSTDKSGNGIGLEQVKKRLELQYPEGYSWEIKQDTDTYSSVLSLKTNIS
ncbi:MAG: histidine kinase [Rikenellaceae bacterium]